MNENDNYAAGAVPADLAKWKNECSKQHREFVAAIEHDDYNSDLSKRRWLARATESVTSFPELVSSIG